MTQVQMAKPRSLNVHLVSDSAIECLATILEVIRAEHTGVRTKEYHHTSVNNQQAAHKVLKAIESAPGILLYTLRDQALADLLEEYCARMQLPCIRAPKSPANRNSKLSPSVKYWVVGLLAAFLIFETTTRSVAAYLREANPGVATSGFLAHPKALVDLAAAGQTTRTEMHVLTSDTGSDKEMDESSVGRGNEDQTHIAIEPEAGPIRKQFGSDAGSVKKIRFWLESALRQDPLNARAFTILGQLEASRKDREQITKKDEEQITSFMRAATQRSLQESNAVHWMMRTSFEAENYQAAIYYADALLRSRQELARDAIIVLSKISENDPKLIYPLLASNPSWRRQFFVELPKYIKDARTPLNILLELKGSRNPPAADEIKSYFDLLVEKELYEVAYYTWLQFLPSDKLSTIGYLFNGSFETSPSQSPFDWNFSNTPGVTIKVVNSPDKDGSQALLLDFGVGRAGDFSVEQILALPPGEYRFEGRYISDIVSKRGLEWRVKCTGANESLGVSPSVSRGIGGAVWEDFTFSFSVPSSDCPAQRIELNFNARYESERFISGSVWYDSFKIERETGTAS